MTTITGTALIMCEGFRCTESATVRISNLSPEDVDDYVKDALPKWHAGYCPACREPNTELSNTEPEPTEQ